VPERRPPSRQHNQEEIRLMSDDRFAPPPPAYGPPAPAPVLSAADPRTPAGWERDVFERLMFASLREQRDARRWRIFFRCIWLLLFALLVAGLWAGRGNDKGSLSTRHTALVSLRGVIDADSDASAEKINGSLDAAFKDGGTAAVILRVNSPGGSPVQAGMIYDEIKRLRTTYPDKPLYVVVEELCASGGYYAAAGADRIFVDKASIVGSIGVLSEGFGFTGAMEKLGVERRLMHAGKNKGIGDPFSPVTDEQRDHLQAMLDDIHQQFIKVVRDGRGTRLKETPDLFSGLFWTGDQSIALGLADDYGTVQSVARDVVKAEDVVDFTEKQSVGERFARRFGASVGSSLGDGLLDSAMRGLQLR
jgi:protease-4